MDPLSITASVLTLVQVCIKSSAALYSAIDGFNSSKSDIRNLKAEVGDLNIVLQALERHVQQTTKNFEVLKLILQQCGEACEAFNKAVLAAFGESGNRLQGVKAWVRLQLRGNDIESFRKLIGSYKATMTIALADSNLQTSKVTSELLNEYIEMTKKAASNLEEQIEELSAKLDLLNSEQHHPPNGLSTKQTLDQKASLEQCLSVCQQLLDHITNIKPLVPQVLEDAMKTSGLQDTVEDIEVLVPRITANAIDICSQSLNTTARYIQDLQEGNQSKYRSNAAQVMKELNTAQKSLEIVKEAQQHRVNTFESIDTAEDCRQVIVSTIGDLIKANGLAIGARTVNVMGQMNDESLQRITDNFRLPTPEKSPSPETEAAFENKHGFGHTIKKGKK